MELLPADAATLEAEELFRDISDAEIKIAIADFIGSMGYIQVVNEDSFLSFRNEELDLNVQVVQAKNDSFRIYFKSFNEWVLVDVVRRIEIAETIVNQGFIVYREAMMKRGRLLLSRQNLLQE
jgi:hypothetical protein